MAPTILQNQMTKLRDEFAIACVPCIYGFKPDKGKYQIKGQPGHQNLSLKDCSEHWNSGMEEANMLAILTGERSNLICIDIDKQKEGDKKAGILPGSDWYKANKERLGKCWIEKTPNGYHIYYRSDEEGYYQNIIRTSLGGIKYTIDYLGHGMVFSYPSKIEEYGQWSFIKGKEPNTGNLGFIPEWLLEELSENFTQSANVKQKNTSKRMAFGEMSEELQYLDTLCKEEDEEGCANIRDFDEEKKQIRYNRNASSECSICNREHDNDNTRMAQIKNGKYMLFCIRDNKHPKILGSKQNTIYFYDDYIKLANQSPFESYECMHDLFEEYFKQVLLLIDNGNTGWFYAAKNKSEYADGIEWEIGKVSKMPYPNIDIEYINNKEKLVITSINKLLTSITKKLTKFSDLGYYPPPLECPKTHLNLFTGFLQKPCVKEEADYSLIPNTIFHIEKVLGNDNETSALFIKNFIRDLLFRPGAKSNVSMALVSEVHGTGKSILGKFLRKYILGPKYCIVINDWKQLVENRFNENLAPLILVIGEELYAPGKQMSTKVKNLITCDTMRYEKKGGVVWDGNSYFRVVNFSNSESPVRIEEYDRRNFIETVSPIKANNEEFYDTLEEEYKNHADIIMRWFLDSPYYNIKNIPKTKIREDVKQSFIEPWKLFMASLYQQMEYEGATRQTYAGSKTIFQKYIKFAEEHGEKIEYVTANSFSKYWKPYATEKRGGTIRSWLFEKEKLNQFQIYLN
jgi:hypothetical protein